MPKKSKLLFVGSAGCTFHQPEIPCKKSGKQGKEKDKRSKKKRVTKVMFEPRSAEKELRMNKLVRRIPGSESWAITWEDQCTSPDYQKLEQISDMNECIAKKNKMRERKQSLRKSRSKTSSRRKLLARSKKLTKKKAQ